MIKNQTLHSDSISEHHKKFITCQQDEFVQDIIVFDLGMATKISSLNKLKTPKLHDLTLRAASLISYTSSLSQEKQNAAKKFVIDDVFKHMDSGSFGYNIIGKN